MRRPSPFSEDTMCDEDHAGISEDLSCISDVSAIDEAQFPEEIYECVDGDIPGWFRKVWTT